jgi:hypothetical protein
MPPGNEIRIAEAYRQYTPPFDVSVVVRRLLSSVPEEYLRGLDCVVLTNVEALSRKERKGKGWTRGRKFSNSRVLAFYHHRSRTSMAYIEVRVDKVIEGTGKWAPRIAFLRDIVVGHVLFHEIGHHIHSTVRPEHREKEDVADAWSGKLLRSFVRKTYWYCIPAIRVCLWMKRKGWFS